MTSVSQRTVTETVTRAALMAILEAAAERADGEHRA